MYVTQIVMFHSCQIDDIVLEIKIGIIGFSGYHLDRMIIVLKPSPGLSDTVGAFYHF